MSAPGLAAFKAYDIRGEVPKDLNVDMAYDIGRAYVAEIKPESPVVLGHDIRESSLSLSNALIQGINDAGVNTVDIGLCGTEMVYYASSLEGMGGGVMVTASHNPKGYNGVKLVRKEGRPISADTGLMNIERRVRTSDIPARASIKGTSTELEIINDYIKRILSFVEKNLLKPLTIIANPGNGCAGPVLDVLAPNLPFHFIRMNFVPDGSFPSGVPNPLLPENRAETADAVKNSGADIGVAWDGDFDRCFFFDENGNFIEGYYIVGFLASLILKAHPGDRIVIDPRLIWNTVEIVNKIGGEAIISKSGHSFMKEKMRQTRAVYGGEMSAHYYFRDFTYCDSGMIPWLMVAQELSTSGLKLSDLVAERVKRYPCSGEINRAVSDPDIIITRLIEYFRDLSPAISTIDGISMEFGNAWRFNLRKSNTEPVVRLNVESAGDEELMKSRTAEILKIIDEV